MLTACSGNSGGSGESSNAPKAAAPDAPKIVDGKFDKPITLTTVRGIESALKFKNGETIDNNTHYKWVKEQLGIELKNLWSVTNENDSYETKLKLMLSSNEQFPDVLVAKKETAQLLIESGKFLDLTQVFDEKASQTWKDALGEIDNPWGPFIKDGKKFAIPVIDLPEISDTVLWIRKDWLNKLSLQPPKTIDELEKIMDAFKTQDPDGDNKNDTYGIGLNIKDKYNDHTGDTSWIFGAYGALPDQWNIGADGKLSFGSVQPEIKQGLAKIKEWKDKGYVPEDVALNDFDRVNKDIVAGTVGLIAGPKWFPFYPLIDLVKADPKADFQPYPIPVGPSGKAMRHGTIISGTNAILINKDISPEALDAFFLYWNTMYESTVTEDPFFLKGYQEGYDYVIKDGQRVAEDSQIPGGKVETLHYPLTYQNPVYPSKFIAPFIKLAKGEKLEPAELGMYASWGRDPNDSAAKLEYKAYGVYASQQDITVIDAFTGAPTATMASRWDLLKKMEKEDFSKIIYGKEPVDSFDSFVKKWNQSGGEQVTKEVNDWYSSVKGK
jgi:putative aldouronate transport system substrate-binding protein